MKRVVPFFVLVLLTSVVPVSAQSTPPPPTDDVERIVSVVERMGGVSNAIQLGIVLFVLIVAYRGLKPLLDTLKDEREARKEERQERLDAQRELAALRERQAAAEERRITAQERQAEFDEKMVERLKELEPADEAKKGRAGAVDAIKEHVDDTVKPLREAADKTLSTISEVERRLDTLATKTELQEEIKPLRESVERLRHAIERQLVNTQPAAPPAEPDTPPDAPKE